MAEPPASEVFIREGRPDEAETVLTLWRQAGATPSVTDSVADLRHALEQGPAFLLLADVNSLLVGSLIGSFDGWRGNLYRLAVHPDHRRRGIARALVAEAERRLAAQGAKRIAAIVESDHPWAMGFWAAVGYCHDPRVVRFVRNL
ncbi:MAG: GNAT family N-acetyltransferase [Planctomycetes bacterium]|nr:GNAT family N-acetyltransferase [Planctomycetota bacterium]